MLLKKFKFESKSSKPMIKDAGVRTEGVHSKIFTHGARENFFAKYVYAYL